MNAHIDTNATDFSELHLVCGSGGTHAFLTGAGTILACDIAGIKSWRSIGGVSGGSIITALYAGGYPAPLLVEKVLAYDFSTLFSKTRTMYEMIRSRLPRWSKKTKRGGRIREGIMKSEGLGIMIDEHVSVWPENFWTMAVSGKYHVLFTAQGVFQISNGKTVKLSDKPAPLGLAIRASCAVPGILESIEYLGRNLFDGALSDYGDCPTGFVRKHFLAPANKIVACDVSGGMTRTRRALFAVGRLISGRLSQRLLWDSREEEIFIAPKVSHLFDSLEFSLTRAQKEAAVLSGFAASIEKLAAAGVLTGDKLALCQEASKSFENLRRLLLNGTSEG